MGQKLADIFNTDLFENMKKREESIKTGVVLSVKEAIAVAYYYHSMGKEPNEIFDLITSGEYKELEGFKVEEPGQELINEWSTRLFVSRMSGNELTSWRSKLSKMLVDPDAPVTYDRLPLAVTLPRFDSYQKRYDKLSEKYLTSNKRTQYRGDVTLKVKYIDKWEEKNNRSGKVTIYAFETYGEGRLVLWSMPAVTRNATLLMDQLLRVSDTFIIKGRAFSKIIGDDKYALMYNEKLQSIKVPDSKLVFDK